MKLDVKQVTQCSKCGHRSAKSVPGFGPLCEECIVDIRPSSANLVKHYLQTAHNVIVSEDVAKQILAFCKSA